MKTVFLRVLKPEDKAAALRSAILEAEGSAHSRFEIEAGQFSEIPRSPFAYWVSDRLRRLFQELPPFEAEGRTAKQGLATADDFRFVRGWWEVPPGRVRKQWFPFAKGGKFSPFYADVYLTVKWGLDGTEISNFLKPGSDRVASRPQNTDFFFRPGLTWPLRTNGFSLRTLAAGCIFGHKGPAAFVDQDNPIDLLGLASVSNSASFSLLVSIQLARTELAQSFEVGLIQRTPIPRLGPAARSSLADLARRAWSLKRRLDTHVETSHAFTLPALLQVSGDTLAARANAWYEQVGWIENELQGIQARIDEWCFELYGLDEADRRAISEGFGTAATASDQTAAEPEGESEEQDETEGGADTETLAAELVSWAAGVAFGRFDVRLATGERAMPKEPDPFEALPVCSPGMLTGDDGLPLPRAPAGYPLTFPEHGILVDDPGHPLDLTQAVRAVFEVVFGPRADRWWQEVAATLDTKDHDLRNWLAHSFFEHHLKRYSRSRRKAPIMWQLATPSGGYSVWLYAHALTRDTFFQVQNDIVAPKVALEERRLAALKESGGETPSAGDRKEMDKQERFAGDLRAMLAEVRRIAPLWKPSLDDGVVLTMAPLWRLVPQHKPWQKELKAKWNGLCSGKYDWAAVAMHLWPERVARKCAQDRSLAIAHGLEEDFWVEGDGGKWQARARPLRSIEDMVAERTSPAVAAALADLTGEAVAHGAQNAGRRSARRRAGGTG
jgi:hypothetical protein